jgi:hypothetical protein
LIVASHDEPGLACAVRADRGIGQTTHTFVRPPGRGSGSQGCRGPNSDST